MKGKLAWLLLAAVLLTGCVGDLPMGEETAYHIRAEDALGQPCAGLQVQFQAGGQVAAEIVTDEKGEAVAVLPEYGYQILPVTDAYYQVQTGREQVHIQLTHRPEETTRTVFANGREHTLYYIKEGNTFVQLQKGERSYFLFAPTREGRYRISGEDVLVGYFGSAEFVQPENLAEADGDGIVCNVSPGMLGTELVLGVDGGKDSCILQIQYLSEPEITWEELPWTQVAVTHHPQPFALDLEAGQKLTYLDIRAGKEDYPLFLGEDGFYRLYSQDGPMVYLNMGPSAPYVSLQQLVEGEGKIGGTAFCRYFFDENGEFVKKEDYTDILSSYFSCLDVNYGIYPLTEDLAYILQNGSIGWRDATSEDYMLLGCTPEIGWLFACCYVQ